MPKKKRESNKQTSVRVGNISDISGNVNVAGGNITTHHTVSGLSAGQTIEVTGLSGQFEDYEVNPRFQSDIEVLPE